MLIIQKLGQNKGEKDESNKACAVKGVFLPEVEISNINCNRVRSGPDGKALVQQ